MAFQERRKRTLETGSGARSRAKRELLNRYYHHLAHGLSLPFLAVYHEAVGPTKDVSHRITVVGLRDPQSHPSDRGLLCLAVKQGELVELPLVEIEVKVNNPNFRLIENYWRWAWNDLGSASLVG